MLLETLWQHPSFSELPEAKEEGGGQDQQVSLSGFEGFEDRSTWFFDV